MKHLILRILQSLQTYLTLIVKSFPQPGELSEVDPQVAIKVSYVYQSIGFTVSHLSPDLGYQVLQFLSTYFAIAVSIKQFKCLKYRSTPYII